jgi:hypothetical protein
MLALVVAIFLAHRLARTHSVGEALAVWLVGMALVCLCAAVLLRSAPVGAITWRNWLAGYILPWGYDIDGGRLSTIVVASWGLWSYFGASTILLTGLEWPTEPPRETPSASATTILAGAINANGLVAFLCLTRMRRPYSSATYERMLWKIIVILVLVSGAGAWLHHQGQPWLGAGLAAAPLGLCLSIVGLYMATVLMVGRHARWN